MDDIDPGCEPERGAVTRRRVVLGGASAAGAVAVGLATAAPAGAIATPPGDSIGSAKEVPLGQWAAFKDPMTHTPSLVIQVHKDKFVAYDAVCPHQGCTVGYVPSQRLIICPCHGSEFDPTDGDVVQGPATRGLRRLGVRRGSERPALREEIAGRAHPGAPGHRRLCPRRCPVDPVRYRRGPWPRPADR